MERGGVIPTVEMQPGQQQPCLRCNELITITLAIEVTDKNGNLLGYRHRIDCTTKQSKTQPGK